MTTNIFYRSDLDVSREYAVLTLTVYQGDTSDEPMNNTLKFKFQANMDEDKTDLLNNWYGGECDMSFRNHEAIGRLSSLARKLTNKERWGIFLEDVLSVLEDKGVEVTYDARMSQNVPIDEVWPVEYHRWLDAPSYPNYGCLARDEKEAQEGIIAKAVEKKDFDYVTRFVQGGQMVYEYNGYRNPVERETIRSRIAKL